MIKYFFQTLLLTLFCLSTGSAENFGGGPFRAGCAQIGVTDSVQVNLQKILAYIHKADSQGVKILLFPETALSGYRPYHFKHKPFPSKETLESALERVCRQARETKIWLVLGTTSHEEDGLYNIVYLIDDQGRIRASHAKTHGTGDRYFRAGKEVRTFELAGMKFGMQICYDARFPEAWRMQALDGARVIFHVSHAAGGDGWKIPVWEGHLRSRTAENGLWVVSCNTSGPVQAGESYIIDPDGLLVAESNQEKEELITGLIDLSSSTRGILHSRRTDICKLIPGDINTP